MTEDIRLATAAELTALAAEVDKKANSADILSCLLYTSCITALRRKVFRTLHHPVTCQPAQA